MAPESPEICSLLKYSTMSSRERVECLDEAKRLVVLPLCRSVALLVCVDSTFTVTETDMSCPFQSRRHWCPSEPLYQMAEWGNSPNPTPKTP